jgi:hypothetical protein
MDIVATTLYRTAVVVVLIASLCGCGEGNRPHNDVKAKQLSPEQVACVLRAENKRYAQAGEFAKQQVDAMLKLRSTIELTVSERRMNEETCLEEAKCYGDSELIVGTMFNSCLESIVRDGTNG